MTRIRILPGPIEGGRVETGSLQFGDDWPGVFIRGDDAIGLLDFLSHPGGQPTAIDMLCELLESAIAGPTAAAVKERADGGG